MCIVISGPFWTRLARVVELIWLDLPIWRWDNTSRERPMAEYLNILHACGSAALPDAAALPATARSAHGPVFITCSAGRIGDAQIGPIYLGWLGLASLICGFISIEIIGLEHAGVSVNWDRSSSCASCRGSHRAAAARSGSVLSRR